MVGIMLKHMLHRLVAHADGEDGVQDTQGERVIAGFRLDVRQRQHELAVRSQGHGVGFSPRHPVFLLHQQYPSQLPHPHTLHPHHFRQPGPLRQFVRQRLPFQIAPPLPRRVACGMKCSPALLGRARADGYANSRLL